MNQQPDKFFRDRLYSYERPVSPQAWNRIAENLKRGNSLKWLGIAAAILLLAVAGIVSPLNTKEPGTVIAEKNDVRENNRMPQNDNPPATPERPQSSETPEQAASAPADRGEKDVPQKKVDQQKNIASEKNASRDDEAVDAAQPVPVLAEVKPEAIDEAAGYTRRDVTNSAASDNPQRKTVTIVLNADEVNEKYLNKSAVAEATQRAKETSRLQKLLDKAYDLKHNQDPLGELRQRKNEIFALNFRGDKQRNEN